MDSTVDTSSDSLGKERQRCKLPHPNKIANPIRSKAIPNCPTKGREEVISPSFTM